jgi:hypothetical protein
MLMAIAKIVNIDGIGLLNPSVNFNPIAHPVSKNPATTSNAHAMIASPPAGAIPREFRQDAARPSSRCAEMASQSCCDKVSALIHGSRVIATYESG